MFIRSILFAFLATCAACESEPEEVPVCFVCADQAPHARECGSHLGRIEFDGQQHSCNLYFGLTQLCESPEYCCGRLGLFPNENYQCVAIEQRALKEPNSEESWISLTDEERVQD